MARELMLAIDRDSMVELSDDRSYQELVLEG